MRRRAGYKLWMLVCGLLIAGCCLFAPPAAAQSLDGSGSEQTLAPATSFAPSPPPVTGRAWLLMDAASGQILTRFNAEQALPMASTTKLMTGLLLAEHMKPDDTVWIPFEARGVTGSKLYLEPGERYRASDMLAALMIASANDAAIAVAVNVAGSEEAFVDMMNERAAELGMRNTRFRNPHGLDADGHAASAYDLALLAQAALRQPAMREAMGMITATIPAPALGQERTLNSHNRFLVGYRWAIGGKTGFTNQAQYCLVGIAEQDGVTLIGVILGGDSPVAVAQDMQKLMSWGFETFEPHLVVDATRAITVEETTEDGPVSREVVPAEPVTAMLPNGQELRTDLIDLRIDGDRLIVYYAGQRIGETSLIPYDAEAAGGDEPGAKRPERIESGIGGLWLYGAVVAALAGGIAWRRRQRRPRLRYRWSRR